MRAANSTEFVHLHVHSEFSLLDGMGKIPDLVTRAGDLGMDALALTDHGSMFGAMNFYLEARRQGIKPIVGCEVYVAARSLAQKEARRDQSSSHLTLLCQDSTGYRNLIGMVSKAHLDGFYYKPRIDLDLLASQSEGIICLSGCPGSDMSRRIRDGNLESARELAGRYREIFGPDRFFIEVMNHDLEIERVLNPGLLQIAADLGARLVGTQDVHYVDRQDQEAHDVLLCIGTKSRVADTSRLKMDGFYHLAGAEEMESRLSEFPGAFQNTALVAEACDLQLDLGRISLPPIDLPEGRTAAEHLRELSRAGLAERRPGGSPTYPERLEHELGIICALGFETYFLIHAEIFQFVRQRGILAGPRGSVGGSLVAYALRISDIDPIQRDIPFERFLNEGRRDRPPDIDMDFPDDHRATVIDYLSRKYGRAHVAQIATFGTMAARQVLRDVGRVMDMPYDAVDRIAKAIPQVAVDPWDLKRALANVGEIALAYRSDPQVHRLIDLGLKLEGISRNPSVHAAGVVVSNTPLAQHLPLMRGQQGEPVSQFTFDTLEQIGFLKLDILGLSTFRTISTAIGLISDRYQQQIDLETIPFDDAATFAMLSKGRTVGCFQLESEGMTRALVQLQPSRVEDLAVLVALYRPGPMSNIDRYVAMKKDPTRVRYLHPMLEPILKETYGVIVYQDQVLVAARELAGFSWPEIDVMRKALGKKIPTELAEQREKFLSGAAARGIARNVAESIYELVEPFGGYGFNKAHAFYYGTVAYWTAYLKANYPREFMAAVLTTASGDSAKLGSAISECRNLGISVEGPDLERSGADFEVSGDDIYFGLAAIKGIGRKLADDIVAHRTKPYVDMADLCKRASGQIGRAQLERLAKCGALDCFGERSALLESVEPTIRHLQSLRASGLIDQRTLFGGTGPESPGQPSAMAMALSKVAPASREQQALWEREGLGINFTPDEYDDVAQKLRDANLPLPDEIGSERVDTELETGGVISDLRHIRTRYNRQMCAFKLSAGGVASLNVTVLPRMFEKRGSILADGRIVWLKGKVESDGAAVRLVVNESGKLEPLARLASTGAGGAAPVPVRADQGPSPRAADGQSAIERPVADGAFSPPTNGHPTADGAVQGDTTFTADLTHQGAEKPPWRLRMSLSGRETDDLGWLRRLREEMRANPGPFHIELELRGESESVVLRLPGKISDPAMIADALPGHFEVVAPVTGAGGD